MNVTQQPDYIFKKALELIEKFKKDMNDISSDIIIYEKKEKIGLMKNPAPEMSYVWQDAESHKTPLDGTPVNQKIPEIDYCGPFLVIMEISYRKDLLK